MIEHVLLDPQEWVAEQQINGRDLFLTIDRLAEPDPIIQLFQLELMQDHANLYAGTDYDALKEVGPWLIKVPGQHTQALSFLLDKPEQNWGWLASANKLEMAALAVHWRDRMLIEETGKKALYRFQDNRVIGHHLSNLSPAQQPILMGPLHNVLCWHQDAWNEWTNPAPASHPRPFARPWLGIPEPTETSSAIVQHNLQQWLWENHPAEVTRLLEHEELQGWLQRQLETARRLGWNTTEQQQFLVQHQLNPQSAADAIWVALAGETPADHYQRCCHILNAAATRSHQ